MLSAWAPAINPSPLSAEWCQCVIFVLNLLGIQQIPGEYWTAASLAIPDQNGLTWMDYQGYKRRPEKELPVSGDLLVLAGGAEVITEQTWSGSEHLVPVQVDVWAGHLGIVLQAESVEKDGTDYMRIHLLSANWGVNSHSLGVVGSCFNVDESVFLLPVGYKKASFFFAFNPGKMRDRMINRANRWAMHGFSASSISTMDGFPINPSGFISQVLEPIGSQPLVPVITDIAGTLVSIPIENLLPGDILLFGDKKEPGFGIITSIKGMENEASWDGQVISFIAGGKVLGPENWHLLYSAGKWTKDTSDPSLGQIRFFRYSRLPSYPVITRFEFQNGNAARSLQYSLELLNGGGQSLSNMELSLVIYERKDSMVDTTSPIHTIKINGPSEVHSGDRESYTGIISPLPKGDYQIRLKYKTPDNPINSIAQLDVVIEE